MKKAIILLLFFIPICGILKAQTENPAFLKIGNISINEKTATAYLLDCYMHPDTLTREYVDGCGESMEKEVKAYNDWLSYAAIKHIVVEIKHPAEVDTIKSYWSAMGKSYTCPYGSIKHEKPYFSSTTHTPVKGYKGHETEFTIINSPEWIEKVEIGFAVPRKPTEIDFIKWLNNQKQLSK